MKKLLSFVAVLAAATAAAAAPAQAQAGGLKVGFVNSQRILAETPGLQSAQATLQRELPGFRAGVDSLEQRFNAAQQAFQQQQGSLTAQAREQRQNELAQQYQALQQRAQQAQERAAQRQEQLVGPVMQQINQAIEAVRREGGYTMVIDSSTGGILAVDPAADLTERVLARVRGGAAAPAAPRQ